MATAAQIDNILSLIEKVHSSNIFDTTNHLHTGIGAMLFYLSKAKSAVTAGDISENLKVSTARVAVLIKKLEANGLIIKSQLPTDARVSIITLTDCGKQTIYKLEQDIRQKIGEVIDKVGIDRLTEFINISSEIKSILPPPDSNII